MKKGIRGDDYVSGSETASCTKKRIAMRLLDDFFVLGYPDSNQERQDQNLQCYHYTIPQFSLTSQGIFSKCAAKVRLFLEPPKLFGTFL